MSRIESRAEPDGRMRVTLTIDDDVMEQVRVHARARKVTLGRAVSGLVRRGLREPLVLRERDGIFVFDLPPDSPVVTTELVRRLESEDL